jgi:hypothetical protein
MGRWSAAKDSHSAPRKEIHDVLRLEAFWDDDFGAGGDWEKQAHHKAIDVAERRDGQENFFLRACRPYAL